MGPVTGIENLTQFLHNLPSRKRSHHLWTPVMTLYKSDRYWYDPERNDGAYTLAFVQK